MPDEQSFLELLEIYMGLVDKQDDIIRHLSRIVARQAADLEQYKMIHGFLDINEEAQREAEETYSKIEEYKKSIEP